MKKERKILKILFCDNDSELLSKVLKYLKVYLDYSGYKKVFFFILNDCEQIKDYSEEHDFFSYKVANSLYFKRQMERLVILPKKDILVINTGTAYGNNVLELVGRNTFTLDDAVLIGLFGIPESWLVERGLIHRWSV